MPFGSVNTTASAIAGRNALAPFALDAVFCERAGDVAEIGAGRDLKGDARERIALAGLERNRLEAELAGKIGAILAALDQREPDDLGVIGDLPVDVGRRQRGVP